MVSALYSIMAFIVLLQRCINSLLCVFLYQTSLDTNYIQESMSVWIICEDLAVQVRDRDEVRDRRE